jgi:hypothetical protein
MKLAAAKKPDLKQTDGDSKLHRFLYVQTQERKLKLIMYFSLYKKAFSVTRTICQMTG